jgi:hypothetical protein
MSIAQRIALSVALLGASNTALASLPPPPPPRAPAPAAIDEASPSSAPALHCQSSLGVGASWVSYRAEGTRLIVTAGGDQNALEMGAPVSALALRGEQLYVLLGTGHLVRLDVSNPTTPVSTRVELTRHRSIWVGADERVRASVKPHAVCQRVTMVGVELPAVASVTPRPTPVVAPPVRDPSDSPGYREAEASIEAQQREFRRARRAAIAERVAADVVLVTVGVLLETLLP